MKQLQVLFSSKQGQDYIKATLKTELEFDEKTFHGSSLAKLYKPAQIAHLFTKEILKDLDFSLKIDDFPFSHFRPRGHFWTPTGVPEPPEGAHWTPKSAQEPPKGAPRAPQSTPRVPKAPPPRRGSALQNSIKK